MVINPTTNELFFSLVKIKIVWDILIVSKNYGRNDKEYNETHALAVKVIFVSKKKSAFFRGAKIRNQLDK